MKNQQLVVVMTLFSVGIGMMNTRESIAQDREQLAAIAKENNRFTTDIYRELIAHHQGNLFVSPYSISTALAMAYAGANGETKAEMAKVLHFAPDDPQLHAKINALKKAITANEERSGFQLRVANRLWGQKDYPFESMFLQTCKTDYGAELGLLDFKQTEAARQEINKWVEDQTNQKIRDLLAPGILSPVTRLVITNAIYFKARWESTFDKNLTADAKFHVSAGNDVDVPLMHQIRKFQYAEADNLQAVELPYGSEELSMVVLLPKDQDGLAAIEKQWTVEQLDAVIGKLKSRRVDLFLPKFKMTSEFSLSDTLKSMGMSLAFSDRADFSKMSTKESINISAVIHKAFVDVQEEGTEAAAATAVVMTRSSIVVEPTEPATFRADHPFLFVIRHRPTGSILFAGRVQNPKS